MRLSFALLVLMLAGCSAAMQLLDTRPSASVERVRLQNVGLDALTLGFEIDVVNPYDFALPLTDLDFALRTDGKSFLDGTTDVGGSVPALGHRTISLPVDVSYRGLMETVARIRPGQVVPYSATLGLHVNVGATPLVVSVDHSGELPVPNAPSVEIGSIRWDEISLQSVRGTLDLELGNTNEFAFTLAGLDYDVGLAGRQVALGRTRPELALEPGQTGTLQIPVQFSPADVGLALLNVLRSDDVDYEFSGSLELGTPFGPMQLPLRQSGTVDPDS